MKTSQYFSKKIKALTADKPVVLSEAPLFEELSPCETIQIVGGSRDRPQESGDSGKYPIIRLGF